MDPISRSQAVGRDPYFRGRARENPRGRGRRGQQPSKVAHADKGKGATPSVHSRIVFSADGETYLKGVPSPVKLDKGKVVVSIPVADKDKGANLDEEYFKEGDEKIVSTISIIPTEYLGEYEGDPEDAYDMDHEEAFSFIRHEDEPGYFQRPSEKQKSHLRPLHITAIMSGIKVNKVLIDGRAAISLLPERMLMKVDKHPDDLIPTNISMTDFSGCYLTSKCLNVKLRYPQLSVPSTGWNCSTYVVIRGRSSMAREQDVSDYLSNSC
ncbi:hypothetical protein Ahy_A09g041752 [Arachis hypogaea]|uniref:Uncharacterized protein n=1 Tax=Arachis hypogaea TaxID=3818 RepID=A0A445BDQ2_ARAHY|nr:hypothetical protein Ahy_A09g041752 [Arachis hypogaea]